MNARGSPLRLLPDELGKVPLTGAVESVQAGELRLSPPLSRVLNRDFLSRAADGYWRFLTQFSMGLFRVAYAGDHQAVVLLGRPLVLLRFHSPEYKVGENRGSVTWRIDRGLLVSRDGHDQGFLRLSVERVDEAAADDGIPVRMQMEVRNFYPWLRGRGRFALMGVWVYSQTQQRIHRTVTRGFLRSLAKTAIASERQGAAED